MTLERLLALVVGTSLALVACGPTRFYSPGGMTSASAPVDPMPLVVEAHAAQRSDPARAFALLAQACEVGHWVDACLEAESADAVRGRSLVVHGCALGSSAACKRLAASEMLHEHKSEVAARADVEHALDLGCAQGVTPACVTRAELDAPAGAALSSTDIAATSGDGMQTVGQRRAVDACFSACKAQQTSCARQCVVEGWDTCPPARECDDAERSCETSCRANAALTCATDLRGSCGPLS